MSMLFWCCFLISGERISSNWISFFGWISWAVFLKMFSLKLKGKRKHCWTWFAIFCSRMHRKKNLRVLIQFVQRFLTVLLKFPAISFFFASHLSSNVFRHFVPVRRPGRPAESSFKMIFCEVLTYVKKSSNISPTTPYPTSGDSWVSQIALNRQPFPSRPKLNR